MRKCYIMLHHNIYFDHTDKNRHFDYNGLRCTPPGNTCGLWGTYLDVNDWFSETIWRFNIPSSSSYNPVQQHDQIVQCWTTTYNQTAHWVQSLPTPWAPTWILILTDRHHWKNHTGCSEAYTCDQTPNLFLRYNKIFFTINNLEEKGLL